MVGVARANPISNNGAVSASDINTPANSENNKTDEVNQKAVEALHQVVHDKPEQLKGPLGAAKTYHYKKVKAGESGDVEIDKRLKLAKCDGSDIWNNAVMSQDGNTLVTVTRGDTFLKMNFGGANWFSRLVYKIFGWGRFFGGENRATLGKRYQELFNQSHTDSPDGFAGEPLKHLMHGLRTNHYHGITVWHKDEKGKLQKVAGAITDSYMYLIDKHMKEDGVKPEEIESYKKKFARYYSIDKVIPLTDKANDIRDLYHQLVEGLYQAQGFDMLTIPSSIHKQQNVNTNDLNYMEMKWHRILQTNDGHWKIVGDKAIAKDEYFKDPKEKEAYMGRFMDNPYQEITFVRPKAEASKALHSILGHFDAWSQMYSGGSLRTKDKADLELIKLSQNINSNNIQRHNVELEIAQEVTDKLEQHPNDGAEGKGGKLDFLKNLLNKKAKA